MICFCCGLCGLVGLKWTNGWDNIVGGEAEKEGPCRSQLQVDATFLGPLSHSLNADSFIFP